MNIATFMAYGWLNVILKRTVSLLIVVIPVLIGILPIVINAYTFNFSSMLWLSINLLIGISTMIVFLSDSLLANKTKALELYLIQLILSTVWIVFFFDLKAYTISFVYLIVLVVVVVAMLESFRDISIAAYSIGIPYLLCLLYASVTNAMYIR